MEFEWDSKKATDNERKHKGVSFHEAATMFGDPLAISFPDPDHSSGEFHFLAFGVSCSNRLLGRSKKEQERAGQAGSPDCKSASRFNVCHKLSKVGLYEPYYINNRRHS